MHYIFDEEVADEGEDEEDVGEGEGEYEGEEEVDLDMDAEVLSVPDIDVPRVTGSPEPDESLAHSV
jgi:hypothetical protein